MEKTRLCNVCNSIVLKSVLDNNYTICPHCGNYLRIHARKRIAMIADKDTFREWNSRVKNRWDSKNEHIEKENYEVKVSQNNIDDAVITGEVTIDGYITAIGIMDTRFMMASMGYVVGEKITRLFEKATAKKIPVILFCCSGGACIQEGIISLMQMGKTAIAVKKHSQKGLLYISILTNPTMGGVTASFATIADVILAEKNATIGFAGARVVEQNIGIVLPKESQTAESKLQHGLVDKIVERKELKKVLSDLLGLHYKENIELKSKGIKAGVICNIQGDDLGVLEKIKLVRSCNRPNSKDFIDKIFDSFIELKGDRMSKEDHTIVGGIARFHNIPITVIGQERGRNSVQEAIYRNWGMTLPSGYRKALRLMKQADKFGRPIICFVDTIGAACGKEAEETGQASTIANMLKEISAISVPILSIIIGEAYSGGAFVLCAGNEVWMLENAIYSVISPEAYSSILWKDNSKYNEAVSELKMEAKELQKLNIVDKIIEEKIAINKENMEIVCEKLDAEIIDFLARYGKKSRKYIINKKEKKFRDY